MVATVIVVGVLVVAVGAVVMQLRGPGGAARASQVHFWDLERDEAFNARDEISPIEAPSGGEGVRAHLFTCGQCTPDEWFGYLERYTDEAVEALRDVQSDLWDDTQYLRENHLVRSLEDDRWVLYHSREGEDARTRFRDRCGPDASPQRCDP